MSNQIGYNILNIAPAHCKCYAAGGLAMRMVEQHNGVGDVLIEIMMVLWFMTAVPTGIKFL